MNNENVREKALLLKEERFVANFKNPIEFVSGEELENVVYLDLNQKQDLHFSDHIHIIDHQLELQFSNNKKIFISWNFSKDWKGYFIGCSNTLFSEVDDYHYEMKDNCHWKNFIKSKIKGWALFGVVKGQEEGDNHHPFLMELIFDNQRSLYFANFHFDLSFVPKYMDSDDLWIIFDQSIAYDFVKKFKFEELLRVDKLA